MASTVNPVRFLDVLDHLVSIGGGAQCRGPDQGDGLGPVLSGLVHHPRDRFSGALHRRVGYRAVRRLAFAEPGQFGAVDDGSPFPVGGLLCHMELDRVGANVDDRVPDRSVVEDVVMP